jgi:hypothetical protein
MTRISWVVLEIIKINDHTVQFKWKTLGFYIIYLKFPPHKQYYIHRLKCEKIRFCRLESEIRLSKISPKFCTTDIVLEKPECFRQKQMWIAVVHEIWIQQAQVHSHTYFHTKYTTLTKQTIGLVRSFPSGDVWKGRMYLPIKISVSTRLKSTQSWKISLSESYVQIALTRLKATACAGELCGSK